MIFEFNIFSRIKKSSFFFGKIAYPQYIRVSLSKTVINDGLLSIIGSIIFSPKLFNPCVLPYAYHASYFFPPLSLNSKSLLIAQRYWYALGKDCLKNASDMSFALLVCS